MDVNIDVKPGIHFRAFYVFFIIVSIQLGIGIMTVPKHIFKEANQDSWVAILIAFVYMIIVVVVMIYILTQYKNADILGIQVDLFGTWIGKILGTIYIVYFIVFLLSILITYIHILQLFIYPTIPSFAISLLLLGLVAYGVLGGIRVIVGIAFIFFFLALWILLLLYDPITRMDITHFQPMFQASIIDLLEGARETVYTFAGIGILFFIYPFIENKQNIKRPAILGVSFSAFIVLIFTIISIGYYSPQDFESTNWVVLRLFKYITFPLLERFDFVVVVEWIMVTIPTMVLIMWTITHGTKRLYAIKQKTTLYTVSSIILLLSIFLKYEYVIDKIASILNQVGFWIEFVYPVLLLPFVLLKKKPQKNKGRAK